MIACPGRFCKYSGTLHKRCSAYNDYSEAKRRENALRKAAKTGNDIEVKRADRINKRRRT